ncbi:hypothetical protein EE612_027880, partial [Oryza sativa]
PGAIRDLINPVSSAASARRRTR